MTRWLVIAVRLHDGRYHGEEDGFDQHHGWPPSPGRLFQALVAGAAWGGSVLPDDQRALRWLENLPAPQVVAPPARRGTAVPMFVPNNDLDAVGGDPDRVAEIRVGKRWRPHFFDAGEPILYIWEFDSPTSDAERICGIATRLYQLGRGVDMAAATGAIMDGDSVRMLLDNHPGGVRSPTSTSSGGVPVARNGTLDSLIERHRRGRERLTRNRAAKGGWLFTQPPKTLFRHIAYDAPPRRLYFDLRRHNAFAPRPLRLAAALITGLRDGAAHRLRDADPPRAREVERLIIGRGAGPHDIARRVRIIPIPSTGMKHTDPSIRRILVEVPAQCPIPWRDIEWAFAGLAPCDPATGEAWPGQLVSGGDRGMANRYTAPSACLFRSITAVALSSARRRLPRATNGRKPIGTERRRHEEAQAARAVVRALRHAGIRSNPSSIHVQREPLHRRGVHAERFADGSRFSRLAMWHVELRLATAVAGPLLIGDGRFCGLGLMAPVIEDSEFRRDVPAG